MVCFDRPGKVCYKSTYASLAASRALLQRLLGLPELYFRLRRFILLVKTKKFISINYGSSTRSWKPWRWMRLDLIFSMRDIYINSNPNSLPKFTSSSRNTKLKDILPWNISQMIMKIIPISMRIVISYAMKWGLLLWIWLKVTGNWDNTSRISEWMESHCRTNTSIRRNKYVQKSRTMRITAWDLHRKVSHLSKVIWDRKLITDFTRLIISTRTGKPVLMMSTFLAKIPIFLLK